MASEKAVYGIDLGTTNSCLARFTDGRYQIVPIDGQATVPSVVAWDGKDIVVGKRALNQARLTPEQAVRSIKRRMGQADYVVALAGRNWTPVEVSSRILGYIKSAAEAQLGEVLRDVVITVPAWFTDPQRRATIKAGELAGLHVSRIVNEPTSAALAYATTDQDRHSKVEHCLVYDLGGGTFDVSVLRIIGDVKEVLASCGNIYLGGDDFDHRLALRLADQLKDSHQIDPTADAAAMAHLRFVAEEAKIKLSTEVVSKIHEFIHVNGHPYELNLLLDRPTFNALIDDYIEGTIAKAREALEQAQLKPEDLSRLLLVGGSTRIPLVVEKLKAAFALDPEGQIDQDLSVAYGAAVQAALDAGMSCDQVVIDVCPHSLGIAALGEQDFHHGSLLERDKHPLTFVPLIRRNTQLPARFVERFFTLQQNQAKIEVAVYQGESCRTRDNVLVGSFMVDLPPNLPEQSRLDIGFEYNSSGIVQVTVATEMDSQPLKRYAMDLARGVDENSEAIVTHTPVALDDIDEDDRDEDVDLLEGADIIADTTPEIANFLIKKVERMLNGASADCQKKIRPRLAAYRDALSCGDDDQLDIIEHELYQWLEQQENTAAGHTP